MSIHISYVYCKSPRSDYNFSYFLENELRYRPDVFYTIVINGYKCNFNIPKLDNCRVIYRENSGFCFGGHNEALKQLGKDKELYNYFFFMNCGVIGPILKNKNERWYEMFTNKFNKYVKLVGTTIVCLNKSDSGGFGPKVESFFFCLDKKGLEIILNNGKIFYNHSNKTKCILNGEYALSKCIINSGHTIDCMLKKYKNINWYDHTNYYLNNNKHPTRYNSFYGKSIDPYEVIFHKWYWSFNPKTYVSMKIIENYTGKKFIIEFDYKYYVSKYKDLSHMTEEEAYRHYISNGYMENRIAVKPINTITNIKLNKKILITYVYYETEISIKNLNFFIKNGVFYNDNIQYNFIINGNKCSIKFPDYKNIKVYKRENEGYDFAGYSYSIEMIKKNTFYYYIFLNDTSIGPFVPRYVSKNLWPAYFVSLITDKVKLVGPTINRKPFNDISEHIQSMAFGTDNVGLKILIENNIFNINHNIHIKDKEKYIETFEIRMSGIIVKNGYNISSFMQCDNCSKQQKHHDIHKNNKYFGINLNPIEIMFIKNGKNRINDMVTKKYTDWNNS